jgi:hypothetical protein
LETKRVLSRFNLKWEEVAVDARSIHPDIGAHEPGCPKLDTPDAPAADPIRYVDVFCECHKYTDPKILMNGTDIAWPAGWTEEQAIAWRKENGLLPPTGTETGV